MSLWAIVPVKALDESKSRLQGVLTPYQRAELSREMLLHTLQVLAEIPEVQRTLVVSADPKVLALAEGQNALALKERGAPALNKALNQATVIVREAEVKAVLVLPADLPLIGAADVKALIDHVQYPPVVAVSPDRRGRGTNALLMTPLATIEYAFGPSSFDRHVRRAEASGARIEIVELPALGLDVDVPEDLEIYRDRFALVKE
ncbi:MAG: 2-phospho-L-lactate guanylyltransferase [Chloroflexi bacterium]|nr:2-phospho-L-lactate guanylyltransferase [Chloroflexota bacterium]